MYIQLIRIRFVAYVLACIGCVNSAYVSVRNVGISLMLQELFVMDAAVAELESLFRDVKSSVEVWRIYGDEGL